MSAHNYHYIRVYFGNYRHIYTYIVNGIWNIYGRLAYSVRNNSVPMAEWKLFVANEFVISTSTLPYRRLRYDLSAYRWRKGAKREDGIEWHTERTRGRERGTWREREKERYCAESARTCVRTIVDRARNFRPKSFTPSLRLLLTRPCRGFHSRTAKARRREFRRRNPPRMARYFWSCKSCKYFLRYRNCVEKNIRN